MSNLSDAIQCLREAEELVDTEAEIDEFKTNALLEMADRIRVCMYDLLELAGLESTREE